MVRKLFLLLAALLMGCQQLMAADGSQKLSYDLRQLLAQPASARRAASMKDGRVCAFVRFLEADGESLLAAYGCEKVTQIGDIYIARIPLDRLQSLADDEHVQRVEAQTGGRLLNDVSPQWTHSESVQNGSGLPQAYDGKGVLLGIVDSGFDVTHPAFYGTDGTTYRIKGFVDDLSNTDETRGADTPLGREYLTEDDILHNLHVGNTEANHATHCLGTAAGSGYGTPYRGVAYAADIFAINSTNAGFDSYMNSADQAARMKRIFDYADQTGQPCVITYSIGFNDVPGESQLFGEALAQMTGPGHILVVSAGNCSVLLTYVSKPQGKDTAGSGLSTSGDRAKAFLMSDQPFRLKLITLASDNVTLTDSITIDTDNLPADSILFRGRHIMLERTGSFYTLTDRRELNNLPDSRTLLVAIEGEEASVEMFAELGATFVNYPPDQMANPRFNCATNTHNVSLPGSLPGVVTIGALNGRQSYVNMNGEEVTGHGTRSPLGTMAVFSSQGPTKDGRIKPDVTSPGVNVISAGNSYCPRSFGNSMVTKTTFQGREYPWLAMSGTSMAAPHAAGIVALWLQAKPTLSPEDIKAVLAATSLPLDDAADYPNNRYGYGLIDAYAGMLHVLGIPSSVKAVSMHQPTAVSIRPTTDGHVSLLFANAPRKAFTVRVFTTDGRLLAQETLQATQATDYRIIMPAGTRGVCVVQVDSEERGLTGSELIRL